MIRTITRWSVTLTSLFVVGPLAAWVVARLQADDGSPHTSFLLADSPFQGLIAGVVAMLVAGIMGALGARLNSVRSGLFATGMVLAWATWATGSMDHVMRQPGASGYTLPLVIEALLLGIAGVVIALAIIGIGRAAHEPDGQARLSVPDAAKATISEALARDDADAPVWQPLLVLTVAMAVGGVATWLVAAESLKGQSVLATFVAGFLATATGTLVSVSSKGSAELIRIPLLPFFVALALLAVAAPIVASVLHGGGEEVARAARTGTLFGLSRPLPMDWIAGAFLGIPAAAGWTESMLERQQPQQSGSATSTR